MTADSDAPQPPLTETEQKVAQHDYDFWRGDVDQRVETSVAFAQSTWKGLMLANGGAIIGLFTVIGNKAAQFDFSGVWSAFTYLAAGLVLTILSNIGGYFSQGYYLRGSVERREKAKYEMHGTRAKADDDKFDRRGTIAEYVGVATALMALAAFILGSWHALDAVTSFAGAGAPARPAP